MYILKRRLTKLIQNDTNILYNVRRYIHENFCELQGVVITDVLFSRCTHPSVFRRTTFPVHYRLMLNRGLDTGTAITARVV